MDSILASAVIGGISRRRERFEDDDDLYYGDDLAASGVPVPSSIPRPFKPKLDWFSTIIGILIAGTAAYLSWTCNEALGYTTLEKCVWAFGAGVFGTLYLVYYALFRGDYCRAAIRAK